MFTRILIANRGEIACRIIRSCRRLGIATVAVYSECDAGAMHVRLADEARAIGPSPAVASYLDIYRLIAAALASGAEAIHPGYGFLSENPDFAEAAIDAGLVFIGPSPRAIRLMGSKSAAKTLMERAGIPLVPGYHGPQQDLATLQGEAERIGYPLLIKPSAGGGGKGMRVVTAPARLAEELAACRREAQAAFGDEQVLLERYLQQPRHIEFQIFGDSLGGLVHLYERDCSVQRRHQKIIEEAPAPGFDEALREPMAAAALSAARAVGYVGAGTVEFIVADGAFHFMEMNTRLQVEHPVTEMITGIDLVEWQLRIAAGERLPLRQEQIRRQGHAIELRLCAEDPDRAFLPSAGLLSHCRWPEQTPQLRLDTGVAQGDQVSPHYDPMLAKLIAHGDDREQALARLRTALSRCQLLGVASNLAFLGRVLATPAFREGAVDTGWLGREAAALQGDPGDVVDAAIDAACLWLLSREAAQTQAAAGNDPASPWAISDGWRLNAAQQRHLAFELDGQHCHRSIRYLPGGWEIDGLTAAMPEPGVFVVGERRYPAQVVVDGRGLRVFCDGHALRLILSDPARTAASAATVDETALRAPMPGRIVALLAQPGAIVEPGEPLLVMEAMKMEHTLQAPTHGRLIDYCCTVGDQVQDGVTLIQFEAQP